MLPGYRVPVVDAHLHLWDPGRLRYPWLAGIPALAQAFGLPELDAARGEVELEALLFVQCDCVPEDSARELAFVREVARRDARLAGAVAFAPLERGTQAAACIEELAREPLVRGVRRLIQSEADPGFCCTDAFVAGVRLLAEHDLTFDLCILHSQLAAATELVRRVPEVTFVLDHLGKPGIRDRLFEPWAAELAQLARLPNVVAKLSGLTSEAEPGTWNAQQLAPYFEHALACFGPGRLLFGGDWPVSTLTTSYPRWFEVVRAACAALAADEQRAVFADNARRVYRLPYPSLPSPA